VRPDAAEMDVNPRARSAILRVAERLPDDGGDLTTGARP
jgi:16S rRNA C1402 N4-methylase RsmH